MKERDILGAGLKTYSDPSDVFSGVRPPTPRIYTPEFEEYDPDDIPDPECGKTRICSGF